MRGRPGFGASLAAMLVGAVATGAASAAGPVRHVDDDAAPGGDGAAWATAFRFLQDALTDAAPGTVLRVAGGVHHADRDAANPDGTGDRDASFILDAGVTIEGGYVGLAAKEGEDPDDRDLDTHATILSGDLAGDDGPSFAARDDNSRHVVRATAADAATRLDGLRLVGGHADGPAETDRSGAGLLLGSAGPTIHACTFESNDAAGDGGAAFVDGGAALFTFCTFVDNRAGIDEPAAGGAVHARNATPTLATCVFLRNQATSGGGAVSLDDAESRLTDCTFRLNRVVGPATGDAASGGGLLAVASAATITGCDFLGNQANGGATGGAGGAVAVTGTPSPRFETCVLSGNQAAGAGGAAVTESASATFVDCTFTGNTVTIGAGGFALGGGVAHFGGTPLMTGCVFTENDTSRLGGAVYDALTDGDLVDSSFEANKAQEGGAVYHAGGTPELRGCVFTANTAFGGAGLGGAVRSVRTVSLIEACVFRLNQASAAGGGLHVDPAATVTLHDDDFCANVPDDVVGPFVDQGGNVFCPGCDADLDGDGVVAFGDLLTLLAAWGPCPGCPEDLDGSGAADTADLVALLRAWGPCPAEES